MTSLLAVFMAMLSVPHAIRVREIVRWQLSRYLAVLVDDETGALREIDPWYLGQLDAFIRDAETLLGWALWLRARDPRGLRRLVPIAPPALHGDPRVATHALLVRIERLARLLDGFGYFARRLGARLNAPAPARHPRALAAAVCPPLAPASRALEHSGQIFPGFRHLKRPARPRGAFIPDRRPPNRARYAVARRYPPHGLPGQTLVYRQHTPDD